MRPPAVPPSLHRSLIAAFAVVVAAALLVAAPSAVLAVCPPDPLTHEVLTPGSAAGGSPVAGAKWGSALATGDFNDDGFPDLAVGAPGDHVGGVAAGAVSVFYGSSLGLGGGTRLTQVNLGKLNEAGDQFGAALAAADLDGDGFDDLAVGIPRETIGTTRSGAIAVFPGSGSGLSSGNIYTQGLGGWLNEAGDAFGGALAAGDVGGDGLAELAVGAPGESPENNGIHSGAVFVFKGSSSGIVKGWSLDQRNVHASTNEEGDRFGATVAISNVTGDGHPDLLVGGPREAVATNPISGVIYVLPGTAGGTAQGTSITQRSAGDALEDDDAYGTAIATGNIDNAGYTDFVVGVPGEAPQSDPAGGAIAAYAGPSDAFDGFTLTESHAGQVLNADDQFGAAIAIGDMDDDGLGDVLIGAPGRASDAGAVYLFAGLTRKPGSVVILNVGRVLSQSDVGHDDEPGDAFGAAVAVADFDNSGRPEAAIGAPGEAPTGQPASGVVSVVSGLVACGAVQVEQFANFSAMQIDPVGGAPVGTLEYAYVDNIGRLVHGHQSDVDNFSSVQWTVISGNDAFSGRPALVQRDDGLLQVAGRNIDSGIWTNTQDSTTPPDWGSWVDQGGLQFSTPVAARLADGRLAIFAVDADGRLWALPYEPGSSVYTLWRNLGDGDLAGGLTAVEVDNGVQLFAIDESGALKTALYSLVGGSLTLSAWTNLGGSDLTGPPAVVVYPGFSLRVVVTRGTDGAVLTKKRDLSGVWPSTFDQIGTFVATGPPSALLSPITGKTEVVARGQDGAIYNSGETFQGSGLWDAWAVANFSEVAVTDPTAFTVSGSASGVSWAFVYLRNDGVRRVITAHESAELGATGSTHAGADPEFKGHTLPKVPERG